MPNVPELRFPEFSGEWVEKRLGEVCSPPKYGINAPAVEFNEQLPTYLRITDINDNGKYNPSKKVSIDNLEASKYILQDGDIVFARTGATVGKTYLYNPKDGLLVYAGYLIKFTPIKNLVDSCFIKFYTETSKYWKWIQIVSMRSGQPGINSQEFSSLKILIPPTLAEQQKIASLLSAIDVKIDLQERKINQLEKYKKALLQKLFPTKDTKVPELRFPEFSGEWVEKRLGEIGNIYQPMTISQKEMKKSGFPVFGANGLIGYYEKYNHLTWQILITCRGSTSGTVNKSLPKSWITGNAMVVNVDDYLDTVNKTFLYFNLLKYNFKRIVEGSGQPQITRQPLLKIKILIPPTLAEQEKIASFLSSIDEKIELKKEKLKKIKEYKKGLLQKMFV